ncbi:MAG TPA: FAD-dependent tricarballylate dehydrogenase TcuA [Acetobacteraceae bacterium]|jgi:tricarballylate dehydrogenase|nr:FAD-dependent tricarballylate dehydrogenase TcuA [Acetobacteraceae bacterium]
MNSAKPLDVVVIGAGNAAANAALAAHGAGATVALIEVAPIDARAGNSAFTGGAFRFVHHGVDDLRALAPDIAELDLANIDFGTYTAEQYFDDMGRLTEYRCDPDLTDVLINGSYEAALWLQRHRVRFQPALGRQAFKVDGKFKFWGGLACHILGGGMHLTTTLHDALERDAIPVHYNTMASALLYDDARVRGVRVRRGGQHHDIAAKSVVLACGGFESNPEWRARYLGPNYDLAKVRGTRFNMGMGHRMATDIGAATAGHWSGAHAVQWDMNAPPYGDISVGDRFQKHNYPFSILVNARGERFVDEGLDFHSYTYAKYGHAVMQQPGLFAWQIFDQKVTHLLREEYRISRITKETANTFEELAPKLTGVDPKAFLETVRAYNAAPRPDVKFNPNIHDRLRTSGLAINKTNWANRLDTPPYEAYGVTCGVTFTFGGLKVTPEAKVEDVTGTPIPGLFAAGEIIGGLYYHNYGSGTGLVAGVVYGRLAGTGAAQFAAGATG